MAVVRWRFYDPLVPETYIFDINPNEGGTPAFKKNVAYQNTAAPNGRTLMFEGRDEYQTFSFSGTILIEAHYNAFLYWWQKRHQIHVTDDLGRQFWIYITTFDPKRVRAAHHPWKHTYTCEATVVDWP